MFLVHASAVKLWLLFFLTLLKCLRKSTASTHLSHHTHLRAMKQLLSVCELRGHAGPAVSISASSAGNQAPSVG